MMGVVIRSVKLKSERLHLANNSEMAKRKFQQMHGNTIVRGWSLIEQLPFRLSQNCSCADGKRWFAQSTVRN